MNGKDFLNNLIDELDRARASLSEQIIISDSDNELLNDIQRDLERYYDYADSLEIVLEDIVIE